MFEESLVESTGIIRHRNHHSIAMSVGIQAAAVAALLSIPLVHPEIISLHAPTMSLVAPLPKPTPPPTPPRERVHVDNTSANTFPAASAPTPAGPRISRPFTDPSAGSDAPPADGGINIGGSGDGSLPPGIGNAPGIPGTRVVAASATSGVRTRISQGVSSGLLLAPIRPVYPPIAKAAHIEGTVIVQAIISKSGAIESARIVSGPAMLQSAALEAVRQAHYKPYLLSGEPTEVDTTFSINFRLGGS